MVPETFKHSRPIKPHNFGHVHQCMFLVKSFLYKFLERVSLLLAKLKKQNKIAGKDDKSRKSRQNPQTQDA